MLSCWVASPYTVVAYAVEALKARGWRVAVEVLREHNPYRPYLFDAPVAPLLALYSDPDPYTVIVYGPGHRYAVAKLDRWVPLLDNGTVVVYRPRNGIARVEVIPRPDALVVALPAEPG